MENKKSFNDWLTHAARNDKKNMSSETVKKAYALLKSHEWKTLDSFRRLIPNDSFEYYEISFLSRYKVSNYKEFNDEIFANSYDESMLNTLSVMMELCPNEKKEFFKTLHDTYNRELLQFKRDMETLKCVRQLISSGQWSECGALLEDELNNGPPNLAWCVIMAQIKLMIVPSYNCEQEFLYFEKHFDREKEAKKLLSNYYRCFSLAVPDLDAFPISSCCVSNMIESRIKYSKRYSSLFLFPYNLVCGMICGIKAAIVGMGIVPIIVCGAEIYHVYQLLTLSKRNLLKKVLVGKKRVVFAQLAYFEIVKGEIDRFWELDFFPGSLFGFDVLF